MTVADNMAYALKVQRVPKEERIKRVREAAQLLDLESYLDRKPKALSGGQRQRVAMGRAIVRHPQVFCMDEPLSNLDAKLRVSTRTQIAELQRRLDTTTVYVTHDQVEAMTMGDRVAVLKDGVLQQCDTPLNLYERPANVFVAGFIGSPAMNLGTYRVTNGNARVGTVDLPIDRVTLANMAREGVDTVTLGVRPESLDIVGEGEEGALPVIVNVVEELGSDAYAYCTVAGVNGHTADPEDDAEMHTRIVTRVDSRNPPAKSERLYLRARAGESFAFSTRTGERYPD
jgi:multiple sugar transport system ATP-binding protein